MGNYFSDIIVLSRYSRALGRAKIQNSTQEFNLVSTKCFRSYRCCELKPINGDWGWNPDKVDLREWLAIDAWLSIVSNNTFYQELRFRIDQRVRVFRRKSQDAQLICRHVLREIRWENEMPATQQVARYNEVFSNLCHLSAISLDGKVPEVIDDALVTVLTINDELTASDSRTMTDAVEAYFGVRLSELDLSSSVTRLLAKGRLILDADNSPILSTEERRQTRSQFTAAQEVEDRVREQWLSEVKTLFPKLTAAHENQLWLTLQRYLSSAFRKHGAETNASIAGVSANQESEPLHALLEESISINAPGLDRASVRRSVREFVTNPSQDRLTYLSQLLDGTFSFYALNADEAAARHLSQRRLKELRVFVDSDFIFSLFDMADTRLAPANRQVLEMIRNQRFPISLHYRPEQLQEFRDKIDSQAADLLKQRWKPEISRAAVASGQLDGVMLAYHRVNSISNVEPEIFLRKFTHAQTLLEQEGLRIFRPPHIEPKDEIFIKDVNHYYDYLKERGQVHSRSICEHDIRALDTVRSLRVESDYLLDAGTVFLTSDYKLYNYDRVIKTPPGLLALTVLPTTLIQLLRPFGEHSEDFDRRFIEALALPEFRTTSVDFSTTVTKMASYMAMFGSLPEETATNIMADELLLLKAKAVEQTDAAFAQLMDSAIAAENERLAALLEETEGRVSLLEGELRVRENTTEELASAIQERNKELGEVKKREKEAVAQIEIERRTKAEETTAREQKIRANMRANAERTATRVIGFANVVMIASIVILASMGYLQVQKYWGKGLEPAVWYIPLIAAIIFWLLGIRLDVFQARSKLRNSLVEALYARNCRLID